MRLSAKLLELVAPSIFRMSGWLPHSVLRATGRILAILTWPWPTGYKKKLQRNIAQAFPNQSASLSFQALIEMFQTYAELPFIWSQRNKSYLQELNASLDWSPIENCLKHGQSVMLLSAHVGSYELLLPLYTLRNTGTVVYKPSKTRWLQKLIESARKFPNLKMVAASRHGIRELIRDLHSGRTIGLLVDHIPPKGSGVYAPFYGARAYTTTLPQRLQIATNCKIFAVALERSKSAGYRLHIIAQNEPLSHNQERAATQINSLVEQLINRMPSQYLWGYNRYKSPTKDLA